MRGTSRDRRVALALGYPTDDGEMGCSPAERETKLGWYDLLGSLRLSLPG